MRPDVKGEHREAMKHFGKKIITMIMVLSMVMVPMMSQAYAATGNHVMAAFSIGSVFSGIKDWFMGVLGGNDDVNTAFYVPSVPTPTMAAGSNWYKSTQNKNTITKVTFKDSYTPKTYDETWNADVDNVGTIKCYRTGTEVIIIGNGYGKILANADSRSMFSSFTKLTTIENLELLDTSKVTSMSSMFSGCGKLTSLDVSQFDTSNVTDMSTMFYICSGLTSLDLSSFNTSNVTNMSWMFADCYSLMSLDLSGFNTAKTTHMGNMFYDCDKLTSLDVSSFDTSKVTNMHSMFGSCSGLRTIYAGDGWSTNSVTSSDSMFDNCTKLRGDIAFNSKYTNKTYAKTTGGYLTGKPIMAAGSSWYKSSVTRNKITKITFMDSCTPTGSEDENWNADVNNAGSIKCYRTGTEIIIAGNGSGKIYANENASYMFSGTASSKQFVSLKAMENLNLLDVSMTTNFNRMFY